MYSRLPGVHKLGVNVLCPRRSALCLCTHHGFLGSADPAANARVCNLWSTAALLRSVCHAALNLRNNACSLESLVRSWFLDFSLFLGNESDLTVDTLDLVPVDVTCLTHIELLIFFVPYSLKHISMTAV